MQSTNPKDLLEFLHIILAGHRTGALLKEEVVDWADCIISKDVTPDIFFIDLALSSSKSTNDVINYISDYLNCEQPTIQGHHLLGFLHKKYKSGKISLEQTVRLIFSLKSKAVFADAEESKIYYIDYSFDLANNNIFGSLEEVQKATEEFLELYKKYSIDNFKQRQHIGI